MISSFKHQINYYYFPPDLIFKDYIAKKGNLGSLFLIIVRNVNESLGN